MNLKDYVLEYVSSGKSASKYNSGIWGGMKMDEFTDVLDSIGFKGFGPTGYGVKSGYRNGDEYEYPKNYLIMLSEPSPIHSHEIVVHNKRVKGVMGYYNSAFLVHFDTKTNELWYIEKRYMKGKSMKYEKSNTDELIDYINKDDYAK